MNSNHAIGGIILCGGRSTRMGSAKAWLPFGAETMLQRIARVVGQVAQPVIVVAAARQQLPELPAEVLLVYDRRPDRGPLEGLAAGLAALPTEIEAAFVTSVDAPLLTAAFARRMIDLFVAAPPEIEIIAPRISDRVHPLAAVYRRSILPRIEEALVADRLRLTELLESAPTRFISGDELRDADPEVISLRNVNEPAEYQAALRMIAGEPGLQPPAFRQ